MVALLSQKKEAQGAYKGMGYSYFFISVKIW